MEYGSQQKKIECLNCEKWQKKPDWGWIPSNVERASDNLYYDTCLFKLEQWKTIFVQLEKISSVKFFLKTFVI